MNYQNFSDEEIASQFTEIYVKRHFGFAYDELKFNILLKEIESRDDLFSLTMNKVYQKIDQIESESKTKDSNSAKLKDVNIEVSRVPIDLYDFVQPTKLLFKVHGDSMIDANMNDGDILVCSPIDKIQERIMIVKLNGSLFVKEVVLIDKDLVLRSKNENYVDYIVKNTDKFQVIANVEFILIKI